MLSAIRASDVSTYKIVSRKGHQGHAVLHMTPNGKESKETLQSEMIWLELLELGLLEDVLKMY